MASEETETERKPEASPPTAAKRGGAASEALKSDRGTTVIADGVVSKVAGMAAREVGGIYAMGTGAARAFGTVTQRVGLTDERTQGVAVEVGETQAAIDLDLVLEYGESIPRVADAVRQNVIQRIEGICGLEVTEVNIAVDDMHFPGEGEEGAGPLPGGPPAPSRVA